MQKVDVKEHARQREQRILQYWKDENTFQKSIEQKEGKPSFVFYEGPPTANGLPHAGHVLGRVFKDFVARYQSMNGYKVRRKAGWDTHGLPVELGVEKQLGISGKKDIEEYGVEAFIQKCKESVFNYERQWREFTESIGYWLDLDDPYVTLDNDYIESVWHILGTIHERDLLYKGHRVTPYCPSCQTSLSSHEVAQGYKDVKDLSATAKFKNKETGEFFIVWTTTPWTLPSNVALAVHEDIDYVKVKQNGEVYILAKNLVSDVFKDQGEYELLSTHKGAEFVGVAYQPPFNFFNLDKGHIVISADFVSDKSGTGIVHLAPAYGEDDYHAVQKHGLDFINPIDSAGRYKDEVTLFAGRFVKDCDVDIVRYLAENNLLFSKEKYEHSYPFCWRCDSPLLYYAMESWFIKTTAVKDKLIENNQKVTWYPEHIKNGRFGKFLEDLIDWNISRSRYWGTPLNVWVCQECEHQFAPKSRAELKEHAQQDIDINIELHKPYVDDVTCSCTKCGGTMKRTPEVIDVWFDSGSMPFAQYHYPFENENLFEEQYPADIICEGIDQTRGWFYSLLAVSTLFKGEPAYKRVMSLGHILDENGQKMSKSKGNVINPTELVEEFGADALRWALISDSAPWNSKRFSKRIVGEAKSKVIDTLNNVHAFFTLYASIDGFKYEEYANRPELAVQQRPLLDRWIISRLQSATKVVKTGLDQYDFTRPSQTLERFIDDLSNWYVRRSRERFWGEGISNDKAAAYLTLHEVLTTLTRLMAPFIPFITEDIHSNLTGGSVHLAEFPTVNEAWLDTQLEQEMDQVLEVVELARQVRNSTAIKTKQPLSELIVIAQGENLLQSGAYNEIIQEEINVKKIDFNASEEELVSYSLKLNFKVAGRKFGKINNELNQKLQALSAAEAKQLIATGKLELDSSEGTVTLEEEDVLVEKQSKEGYASTSGTNFTVALNTELTEALIQEGLVREVARAIQDYRKKLNLPVEKRIQLALALPAELKQAVENFNDLLHESVLIQSLEVVDFDHRTDEFTVVQAGKDELGIAVRG